MFSLVNTMIVVLVFAVIVYVGGDNEKETNVKYALMTLCCIALLIFIMFNVVVPYLERVSGN